MAPAMHCAHLAGVIVIQEINRTLHDMLLTPLDCRDHDARPLRNSLGARRDDRLGSILGSTGPRGNFSKQLSHAIGMAYSFNFQIWGMRDIPENLLVILELDCPSKKLHILRRRFCSWDQPSCHPLAFSTCVVTYNRPTETH